MDVLPHSREFESSQLYSASVGRYFLGQNSVSGSNPKDCPGTFLPLGLSCFVCCLPWSCWGQGIQFLASPFTRGVGRAAKQPVLPALPFSPREGWEAEIPQDGCPNNREGPVGSLGPAHWAKGCSSAQAEPESGQPGKGQSLGSQVRRSSWNSPLVLGCLCSRTWVLLGAANPGPACRCSTPWHAKTNMPIVL
jgi:hypothetical protein